FEAGIKAHGLALQASPGADRPHGAAATASWRDETGFAPELLTHRARLFDLTILGRSDRVIDEPHSDVLELIVLESGRPVLIAPAKMPAAFGERVAIGWNDSPQAARAVAG